MRTVIVGFSKPIKFKIGAEIIKLFQSGTKFSHVYLRFFSPIAQRHIVYQASHGDVNCLALGTFLQENEIVAEFEYEMDELRFVKFIQYCIDNLQKPYGYMGLILLALKKLVRVKGDGEKSFHCSEFAARALPEFKDGDFDFIEPVDLFEKLTLNKDVKRVI
jgi:hypothetical protein